MNPLRATYNSKKGQYGCNIDNMDPPYARNLQMFRLTLAKNRPKILESSTSAACKIFPSLPRFICYFFLTPKGPIPTPIWINFRLIFAKKKRKLNTQKFDLPLFGELGQTSQDLADLWSKTQESWDVCRNSSKSVFSTFLGFLPQHMFIHHTASAKIRLATFWRVRTNVRGSGRSVV